MESSLDVPTLHKRVRRSACLVEPLHNHAKSSSSRPAQALLFLPAWKASDTQNTENQTRIRRHVMKNVLRARQSAVEESKCPLLSSQQSQLPLLPFADMPTQTQFYMPAFINNWMTCFLPRMVSRTEDALTSHQGVWLQAALKHEALFHATLALSAAYHHNLSLEKLQFIALYHVGQAISQINLALSKPDFVIDDNTILTVVAIAAYENLKGDVDASRKHLNGLHSLTSIRGGLGSIGLLARHALNWVDCSFATATATRPIFSAPNCWLRPPSHISHTLSEFVGDSISLELQGVLSQLQALTEILHSSYSRRVAPDEMWLFSDMRNSVEHQLLLMPFSDKISSTNDAKSILEAIAEVIRLGAMIYVNLVLRCILPLSSVHQTLSTQMTQSLGRVQDSIPRYPHEALKVILWSFMLAGAVGTNDNLRQSVRLVVLKLYAQLGISSWEECCQIMESVVFSERGCGDLCEEFHMQVVGTQP